MRTHSGKPDGDNLDPGVTTNDVRMTSKSKDYHLFPSDFYLAGKEIGREFKFIQQDEKPHSTPKFERLRVPLGGDRMSRVRLQGVKALKEETHTVQSRFDQLEPVIVEMFHILQDFLEKLCKAFLKLVTGMDKDTHGHLKLVTQRSNVNGKIKVRFKYIREVCVEDIDLGGGTKTGGQGTTVEIDEAKFGGGPLPTPINPVTEAVVDCIGRENSVLSGIGPMSMDSYSS
ncbi:LOW QUALITY PROTEIN: uncharacterized protein LOC124286205 [Haliotis rubra]|uniref:LOW QUALITY PROTEIN: uncharacterized protein LOC124286205 n=1 Tax=Haliotis rubra TaxID=36100 RepID=UPI001EE4FE84|nr:LOW QUALITY PROTEIN: uncharacterized protein LOC124286205 [Haliotis rubra]